MIFCLHVEFVFMLMSFTWLTDDLLKDKPPSKFGWSIFAAQICLFCGKYEKPKNLGIVQACSDKSHLCSQIDNKTNCSPGSSRFSICGRTVSPYFGTLFMPWCSGYPRNHPRIPRLLVLWVSSDIPKLFFFAPCTEQLFTPDISIYKPKMSNLSTTFEDMRPNTTFLNWILCWIHRVLQQFICLLQN